MNKTAREQIVNGRPQREGKRGCAFCDAAPASADVLSTLTHATHSMTDNQTATLYAQATDGCLESVRISELVYAVAERFPGLLPTRARIAAERALRQQSAKDGHEIDQGLFIAHVLADVRCGMHLVHAMLRPK